MNKRLIGVEVDGFSGWCCSHWTWGVTAPRLETTIGALAFNRIAQEDLEKHTCTQGRGRK